jgi:hypothetical protein
MKDLTASMGRWHPRHGVMLLVGISQDNRALIGAWRLARPIDHREEVTTPLIQDQHSRRVCGKA